VGGDDGGHDRQAEAGAAQARGAVGARRGGAGPGGVGPVEALEDPAFLAGRQARALVGHLQDRLAVGGPDPDVDAGAGRGVDPGVGQEVAGHLAEPGLVAGEHQVVGMLEGHRPGRVDGRQVGQGVGGHGHQVDRPPFQGAALVEAGQEQQVLDEEAHAGGLVLDAAHGPGQVLGPLGRAPAEQFGVPPDGGERRAQLVAGVGHEAAQPVLGGGPFGEGRLDLGQHGVEGQAEAADLGVGLGRLDPAGQVPAGDVAGGFGDAFQRGEPEADDGQRQQRQEEQDGGREDQLDADQAVQRLVELGGGEGDVEGGAVVAGGGQHPVADVAADRADGGVALAVRGRVGQLRKRAALHRVLRGRAAGAAQLPEGAARDHRPAAGEAAGEPAALGQLVEHRRLAVPQLRVEAVVEVVGQGLVDAGAAGRQADDGQGQQAGHQPGPQRPHQPGGRSV